MSVQINLRVSPAERDEIEAILEGNPVANTAYLLLRRSLVLHRAGWNLDDISKGTVMECIAALNHKEMVPIKEVLAKMGETGIPGNQGRRSNG